MNTQSTLTRLTCILTFACCAVVLRTHAVLPPPDGGYANFNTAEGFNALFNLATGSNNVAVGYEALFDNDTGTANTAVGREALFSNTFGASNTALGYSALHNNTVGGNTAVGSTALTANSTGTLNTGTGYQVMHRNSTGSYNSGYGFRALYENESGSDNAAFGNSALYHNTGSNNAALGWQAGYNLTIGSNNVDIGSAGVAGESNTIRIGECQVQNQTYIAGIFGAVVPGGIPVFVNNACQLGTNPSSARFKENIQPMDKTSEAILALKPVTFQYKHELDPKSVPQFGLVAEQVEKVNPGLVVRDEEGKAYAVRYEAVNAMLLNEFLKEHRKVEEQQVAIRELKASLARQEKETKAIIAGLQKVNNQLELMKPAPGVVSNDQ